MFPIGLRPMHQCQATLGVAFAGAGQLGTLVNSIASAAFRGEYFVERYGAKAAEATPPIKRMLAEGVPVGAGTDATRVSSYNPWTSLYWMVSGRTVGGLELHAEGLPRHTALELVVKVPGHWRPNSPLRAQVHHCSGPCGVHSHSHEKARLSNAPVNDFAGFWGAFGCSCFAF